MPEMLPVVTQVFPAPLYHTDTLKFLSGTTASLNVETLSLRLQCKESKGFSTEILKSSNRFYPISLDWALGVMIPPQ
jgi:hypothetical protein